MTTRFVMTAAVLATLALAPAPALAKSDISRIAKQLRDPQMQDAMAAAVRAMSDAMLDMKIAPLLEAAESVKDPERARRVDPDTRLRDYAGGSMADMPDRLSRRLPAMMGAMGGMAAAVDEMQPALKGMAKQMGAAVGASMARSQAERSQAERSQAERADPRGADDEIPAATEE